MPVSLIYRFEQIDSEDLQTAGIQGVNLGILKRSGISIPDGFIIATHAYNEFSKKNNLEQKTRHLLNSVNLDNLNSLKLASKTLKKNVIEGDFPDEFKNLAYLMYKKIGGILTDSPVNVRLSPVKEKYYRNFFSEDVLGEATLLEKIKQCWAMNFDEDHLLINFNSNTHKNFLPSAILVQKVVNPDASGKIFTLNPENSQKQIIISASYGIFDSKTNLAFYPDEYIVNKHNLSIELKKISNQVKMFRKNGKNKKIVGVLPNLRKKQKITDEKIYSLAKLAKLVEKNYYFPQEIDWVIENNQIYLTKIKPMTNFHTLLYN